MKIKMLGFTDKEKKIIDGNERSSRDIVSAFMVDSNKLMSNTRPNERVSCRNWVGFTGKK